MKKKEPRDRILYVRIKESNDTFINKLCKKLKYKSKSELVDAHFDAIRNKMKSPLESKSA